MDVFLVKEVPVKFWESSGSESGLWIETSLALVEACVLQALLFCDNFSHTYTSMNFPPHE